MYCTIHGPYGILWFCPLFWWVAIHCLERGWQNWWVFIHLFFCDVDTTLIFRITYNITTYNLPIPGWWFPIFYRCVHPELWRKFPFWRAYVSDGSVQPPRKFRCKHHPRFIPTHREIPPNRKNLPPCRGFTSSYRHMTCRKPGGCGTLAHWKETKTMQYLCQVGPLVVIKGVIKGTLISWSS